MDHSTEIMWAKHVSWKVLAVWPHHSSKNCLIRFIIQQVSVMDPTFSVNRGSVRVTLGVPTHPSPGYTLQYTVKLWQVCVLL